MLSQAMGFAGRCCCCAPLQGVFLFTSLPAGVFGGKGPSRTMEAHVFLVLARDLA